MKSTLKIAIIAFILAINLAFSASAILIKSVESSTFAPGQEGTINIEIENTDGTDLEDVSLTLTFTNLPFIPIGSSEDTVEEIKSGDEEDFTFKLKSSNSIVPGDYEIPFSLNYEDPDTNEKIEKKGTVGIKVRANPDLVFSVNAEDSILNKKGKITLKIVNKGFYDARFLSVKVIPAGTQGYTLLSESEVYVGSVDSDDFETATFDVLFKNLNADFKAIVEYKDFDNEVVTRNINLPLTIYTQEKAIELGLIKKDKTLIYATAIITLIVLWLLYRSVKKRRRLKRSMQNNRS